MAKEDRFKGAIWFRHPEVNHLRVTLGGIGGIGSWVGLLLSRSNIYFNAYDDDSVEEHNLGGQAFQNNSVGSSKVSALLETLKTFASARYLLGFCRKILDTTNPTEISIICIAAFDNIEARKTLFELWQKRMESETEENKRKACFIDGRLDFNQYRVFYVPYVESTMEEYKKHLDTSVNIPDAACTEKQTSFLACTIAGNILSILTSHFSNVITLKESSTESCSIPFSTEVFPSLGFTEYGESV